MTHALSGSGLRLLERFTWSRVLVSFDFDGTLAPIVPMPSRAAMRHSTRQLLTRVADLYPCVVISGRTRADTARRLPATAMREVIGNHGIERVGQRAGRLERLVARWKPLLAERLKPWTGVWIENKRLSLAIHYRRARQKRKAVAAILEAAAVLTRVRIVGGMQVVNLLPAGGPHKGVALEQARTRQGCDTAIYVGDDENDEDVFALDQPGRLLSIRVGIRRRSQAAYYIRRQSEIDELLRFLIRARTTGCVSRRAFG